MAELKTKPQSFPVHHYLDALDENKKKDAQTLISIISDITQMPPVMWGPSIIGFGQKRFRYASGREIDYFLLGFSMRKNAITLYLSITTNKETFFNLGPHTKGVGCLYLKNLNDIRLDVLRSILKASYTEALHL